MLCRRATFLSLCGDRSLAMLGSIARSDSGGGLTAGGYNAHGLIPSSAGPETDQRYRAAGDGEVAVVTLARSVQVG